MSPGFLLPVLLLSPLGPDDTDGLDEQRRFGDLELDAGRMTAVVLGTCTSETEAAQLLQKVRAQTPAFVVHDGQLLRGYGDLVVVAGLFEQQADARRWMENRPDLEATRWTFDTGSDSPPWPTHHVIEMERDAQAYRLVGRHLEPACKVRAGELFVVERDAVPDEVDDKTPLALYGMAPVRCGDTRAYVQVTKTRFRTRFLVQDDRLASMSQLVEHGACDGAIIDDWQWRDGRRKAIKGADYWKIKLRLEEPKANPPPREPSKNGRSPLAAKHVPGC